MMMMMMMMIVIVVVVVMMMKMTTTTVMMMMQHQYYGIDDMVLLQVARLTHAISVFTEGILMMKTTLVGIIKVTVPALFRALSITNIYIIYIILSIRRSL